MVSRRLAIVTLAQKFDENPHTEEELEKLIREAIGSSIITKSWTIDHIAFIDDTMASRINRKVPAPKV